MTGESCARCGKAAELAPCYTRPGGEVYHYQCIMISVPLEKAIALEPPVNTNSLGKFQQIIIDEHNKLRSLHHSPTLTWSRTCEDHAKKWVSHLLNLNKGRGPTELELQHDSYQGMGENLYLQACGSTLSATEAATRVARNWYSEEEGYDYDSNEFTHDGSHFSQLVWKGSWKVGAAYDQVGSTFVAVANYWPAGNIQAWFIDNVLKK